MDSFGTIHVDTTMLHDRSISSIGILDSTLFVCTYGYLHVFSLSDPAQPESLLSIETIDFWSRPLSLYDIIVADSIIYGDGNGRVYRFQISNLDSIYEIDSYSSVPFMYTEYPFSYMMSAGEDNDGHDPYSYWRTFSSGNFVTGDSTEDTEFILEADDYMVSPCYFAIKDSIAFFTVNAYTHFLESYQMTPDRDSIWLLDKWSDITSGYEGEVSEMCISDSLLILAMEPDQIYVLSISDPSALRTLAYYCDTTITRYFQPFVVDSFIVVPSRYNTRRIGLRLFVYPSTDSSSISEPPQPLNPLPTAIPITRSAGFLHSEREMGLYDIRGRELARGRSIDTRFLNNGVYIANNGTASVKISVVR